MELITPGLGLIFWMTMSFGLVLIVLRKYAWMPILSGIKARERTIARSLISARRIQEELGRLDDLRAQKMKETDEICRKMLIETELQKSEILEQAMQEAHMKSRQILDEAAQATEAIKRSALLEIKEQMAQLTVEIAEKVLQQELSNKENSNKYVQQLLTKMEMN